MSNEESSQNNLKMIEWMIKHQVSTQLTSTNLAVSRAVDSMNKNN